MSSKGNPLMQTKTLTITCRLTVLLMVASLAQIAQAQSGAPTNCTYSKQDWLESKLFMGLSRSGGMAVSRREWDRFVADNLVVRFPHGFTIIETTGYWQDKYTKATVYENGKQVVILHEATPANEAAINQIAESYRRQFDQQSVLISSSKTHVRFCELP
jgi:hypothetical protein